MLKKYVSKVNKHIKNRSKREKYIGVYFDTLDKISTDAIVYTSEVDQIVPQTIYRTPSSYLGNIRISNTDPLSIANEYAIIGVSPCILLGTNSTIPGGGTMHGKEGQEEDICRRTTLYPAMAFSRYPIEEFKGYYYSDIVVMRYGEKQDFGWLDEYFKINVISIGNYQLKNIHDYENIEGIRTKINLAISNAYLKGNTHLIITAYGAGKYNNNQHINATLFYDALVTKKWRYYFNVIEFAINNDNLSAYQYAFKNTNLNM